MPAEIVTIAASGFAGPNRSFEHLERCTGLTTHYRLTSNDVAGSELEFYIQTIRDSRPRIVLFGGWCDLYAAVVKSLRRSDIRFGIWWLSTAGQTDMSADLDRLVSAISDRRIACFGFAHKPLADSLRGRLKEPVHLPVPMYPEDFPLRPIRGFGPAILSLFCSPYEYRRKNILNTLLALATLREEYVVYLNGLSHDRWYRRMLKSLNIQYVDRGWMTDKVYLRKLDRVDIGIQVSFTESFNQVAAEHVLRSIPVVASAAVQSMAGIKSPDRDRLIVESLDDPEQIAMRVRWLIRHPKARREIGHRAGKILRKQIERNNLTARNVLRSWLSENETQ